MPRLGGEADKFGNRYESLWAVDAALDLVDDEQYVDITFEAIGDEAAGVEFFRTIRSGAREYHSIKRQQPDGNWTISRLAQEISPEGRSILRDLTRKIETGAEGVFSSGTSATELEELTERARASDSIQEFRQRISESGQLSGRFYGPIVDICGDDTAAYVALRRLRVRTKNEPELTKDLERRVRTMFRMSNGDPTDPTAVRLLVADFVTQKLGAQLTADSFLSHLRGHGVLPLRLAGNGPVGQLIERLNRLYLNEVDRLLINQARIDRLESAAACTVLLDKGKSVMLEGPAGDGKTCVMAQVIDQLTEQGVPCLVLRLDRLNEYDHSAQMVGTRRGLPESPAITLGEFAGDRPSVLCIDQLDALSIVSARQQSAWDAFNELLDEVESYPNMRILFACRSFDLEQDAQLRALASDASRIERMPIGLLDDDTIQAAIATSGIEAAPLSGAQLRILSIPLHLYLYLETSHSGRVDFASKGELFDAFWNYKESRVDSLAGQGSVWPRAVDALCDAMSQRETLVAPLYVMDEYRQARTAMASEAVIYVQDDYIRFFHEAFFDYAFARGFLRANSDLVGWLASDKQHLFRRSQVRQVLAFLRGREQDRARYLQTLADLLAHVGIRFHIKKLVLDWLHALPDPTQDEWRIVEALEEQLSGHRWGVVHNSVPWFDVLYEMGRWESWLHADEEQVDRAVTSLGAPGVFSARSAVIAALVAPFQGHSESWRHRLQWLVKGGYGFTSPEMEDLTLALIADGTLDDMKFEIVVNSDWWSIWYVVSAQNPAFVARVIGAWFDRQLAQAAERGDTDPFSNGLRLALHSQSSEHVVKQCAEGAPTEFVRELFPRFVRLEGSVPTESLVASAMLGAPDAQLREALIEAMASLAQSNPTELDAIMNEEALPGSNWMSGLVLRAWSANPETYSERIVSFILEHPNQMLDIGYTAAFGSSDLLAAISRTAVSVASANCSQESFLALEDAILSFTPDWEQGNEFEGRTRLALLRALAEDRIGEAARQEIRSLEQRFPNAPERGAPEPPGRHVVAQMVRSPISSDTLGRMSDDQLLSAMKEYATDTETFREGKYVGGVLELSREMEKSVRKDTSRFSALVTQMDETHSTHYFEAILRGLASGEEGSGRPGTLEQVIPVLRRIEELGVPVRGEEIARAIGALAEETLPEDIVRMLCRVAEDPDPEVDDWRDPDKERAPLTQAINSARGAAAEELARLLFADRSRWEILRPTVERLVVDRVLAVRSVAVRCLLAILDTHRSDALNCFERLITGAEPIRGTPFIEQFVHYAMFRDYTAMRPTLMMMLNSSEPAAVRVAAQQLTLASLWIDEARGDEEIVLQLGEEGRSGAAFIYAHNLSDKTIGGACEERLRTLFLDESAQVRQAASRWWIALEPDELNSRGSLISAFAESMNSDDDVGTLAYRLKDARRPLPAEVCTLAEQMVRAYGTSAASVETRQAGAANMLAPLLVRLHEQTSDPLLRERILNVIDDMLRVGFWGIDEQIRQQFDR